VLKIFWEFNAPVSNNDAAELAKAAYRKRFGCEPGVMEKVTVGKKIVFRIALPCEVEHGDYPRYTQASLLLD
jgi:hypothetical protein